MKSVAILLSADSFEKFFGGFFGLTAEEYVRSYRNDFAWYYAGGLTELGHRVAIYVLSRVQDRVQTTPEGIAVRFVLLSRWWRFVDPVLSRLARRGLFSRLRARLEVTAFQDRLRAALKEDRIDVLYVQEIWPHRIDFLRLAPDVELMGADHGAPAKPPDPGKARTLRRLRRITVQDEVQRRWIEQVGAKAALIPNGIDTTFFAPAAGSERTRSVLAVGRLVDGQKRVSDLIAAVAGLPDFHLDIVGSGPDQDALERRAADLGLGDRVTFHGFVSDRGRLRELYARCGVFCCPSAWEATLLVLLEAMACGAACVASDIPTLRQTLGEGAGIIFPLGDAQALSRAIEEAYARRVELGEAARARLLANFDERAMMQRLSRYIES